MTELTRDRVEAAIGMALRRAGVSFVIRRSNKYATECVDTAEVVSEIANALQAEGYVICDADGHATNEKRPSCCSGAKSQERGD